MLAVFLFIAFAGMDWVTRIQKSLLVLLILAQVDMFIGSFVNTDFGSLYIDRLEDGKYFNVDGAQRAAYGYTGTLFSHPLDFRFELETLVQAFKLN